LISGELIVEKGLKNGIVFYFKRRTKSQKRTLNNEEACANYFQPIISDPLAKVYLGLEDEPLRRVLPGLS
jgi:hypothetical protein